LGTSYATDDCAKCATGTFSGEGADECTP